MNKMRPKEGQDIITIDILDHLFAQMSIVTDVVTIDILDHLVMVH